jgi:hypothetical protein
LLNMLYIYLCLRIFFNTFSIIIPTGLHIYVLFYPGCHCVYPRTILLSLP